MKLYKMANFYRQKGAQKGSYTRPKKKKKQVAYCKITFLQ